VTPGLILNGQITGGPTGSGVITFTKAGGGTLFLSNDTTRGSAHTLGGGGPIIDNNRGEPPFGAGPALRGGRTSGPLHGNNATQGIRVTGSFSTGRIFTLNGTNNGIDVTVGNTLTLTSAFATSAATNTLQKNDLGTLTFGSSVDNSSVLTGGTWTIAAGAI